MSRSHQQSFISTIHGALGSPAREPQHREAVFASAEPDDQQSLLDRIRRRSTEQRMQLLDGLTRAAAPLNLPVVPVRGAAAATETIRRLVHDKQPEWGSSKSVVAWQHPLIENLMLSEALAADHIPLHLAGTELQANDTTRAEMRMRVVESFVGITAADHCLADTATLVLTSGPGRPRTFSLVPSIHVAVISLDQIIADLTELYAILKQGANAGPVELSPCLTFITGPSKTADIELNMVHGAHGPREMHIIVLIS